MLEFALLLAIVFVLAYPLGKYLAAIMHNREMKIDPLFNWIEKPIYAVFGTNPKRRTNHIGPIVADINLLHFMLKAGLLIGFRKCIGLFVEQCSNCSHHHRQAHHRRDDLQADNANHLR